MTFESSTKSVTDEEILYDVEQMVQQHLPGALQAFKAKKEIDFGLGPRGYKNKKDIP